ncbi:Mut7-C RNAse domain-containing protein [Methanocalculus sp.]|uniref:Mut7-C RNAse domain-containing protein n=1 Tax=Methanocalculus sp. TaxID=2004547 RepID=UPI00271E2C69|nr:Mut7-C RNAse domain-containing protein [Methanocalculus sp.]MDO8841030.1 Mut7-C RNAse domain-containing protein [Methanocalculus sp.]
MQAEDTNRAPMNPERKFLGDRMLGTLTRYLRFLGYDCESADTLPSGNPGEDTMLLAWAEKEGRILLTRDRELAGRAREHGMYIREKDILDQVKMLREHGLIDLKVRLIRCSLCNTLLRGATDEEIRGTDYAPSVPGDFIYLWCPTCRRLYWNGTHSESIIRRIDDLSQRSENAP